MNLLTVRLLRIRGLQNVARQLHTSRVVPMFHEDENCGFPHISDRPNMKKFDPWDPIGNVIEGYGKLKRESKKLVEEIKENFRMDPDIIKYPNEVDVQWKFRGDPDALDQWVTTVDSDYNLGYSSATLQMSPIGTGVFSGVVDTRVPKDGKLHRAGFANIRTVQERGAFMYVVYHVWTGYSHLILRIRGDGRSYMVNISLKNDFDIQWADVHSFPLYTRGGPYWQYVRIPFSKFFFSNHGRVQDSQAPVRLHEVKALGITAAGVPGPFRLEIDYIGLEWDPTHDEEFAYEMYKPPNPYYI